MARHGFGRGEYKYFAYPLPEPIAGAAHRALSASRRSPTAGTRRWASRVRYPAAHDAFLAAATRPGRRRPTPLLLQYGAGDYNCLHQDLYGELVFPLQATVLLSQPGADFTGGEFVLTEQRPRMQSRAEVVPLRQGEAVIFPVHHRPVQGTRGVYRVNMRHGVSRIRAGQPPHAGRHLPRREVAGPPRPCLAGRRRRLAARAACRSAKQKPRLAAGFCFRRLPSAYAGIRASSSVGSRST